MKKFVRRHAGIIVILLIIAVIIAGFVVRLIKSGKDDDRLVVQTYVRNAAKATVTSESEEEDFGADIPVEDITVAPENMATPDPNIVNEDGTIDVYIDGVTSVTSLPQTNVTGLADDIDLDPDSRTVLVNKMYPLESDYKADDLRNVEVPFSISYQDEKRMLREEAACALEAMFASAKKSGCDLIGVSGFRSYQRQKAIYNNNLVTKGYDHTNKYSARPGRSEHQTGWAIDLSCDSVGGNLTDAFIDTTEGQWVAQNCYRFGFIIRYPKDKEEITGYSYEPWHVRYVGYDLAKYLYDNNITLDEYYGYKADLDVIEQEEREYYNQLIGTGYQPTDVPMDEPTTANQKIRKIHSNGEKINEFSRFSVKMTIIS